MIEKAKDQTRQGIYLWIYLSFRPGLRVHGYIEKIIHTSGIKHALLEREFDGFLMTTEGLDPTRNVPTGHIKGKRENAGVMAPFLTILIRGQWEKYCAACADSYVACFL